MEALFLTVLCVFAFLGVMFTVSYLLEQSKDKVANEGIRLILCMPKNSGLKVEGLIRKVFSDEIPEKLMTDGKLYIMVSHCDKDTLELLQKLKVMYPLEILPEEISYCMITDR